MANCTGCSGGCSGSCGGCASELLLTPEEAAFLQKLSQTPFLPVARKADSETPIYLEDRDLEPETYSLVLACLEKKGLIDLDYHQKLSRFDYSAYHGYPLQGSLALTARGQAALELLEILGATEEQSSANT